MSTVDYFLFESISSTDRYDLRDYTDSENVDKFRLWIFLDSRGFPEAEVFLKNNYEMIYPYLIGLDMIEVPDFKNLTEEAKEHLKYICAFDNEDQFREFYRKI